MIIKKSSATSEKKLKRTLSNKHPKLSVVSVRVSDREKESLEEIMISKEIRSYSDLLRMAIQMIQVKENDISKQLYC